MAIEKNKPKKTNHEDSKTLRNGILVEDKARKIRIMAARLAWRLVREHCPPRRDAELGAHDGSASQMLEQEATKETERGFSVLLSVNFLFSWQET
jgi:hypothetical protein